MNKVTYLDFIIEQEGYPFAIDDFISFSHNVIGESLRIILEQNNQPTTYSEVRKEIHAPNFLQALKSADFSKLPPVYRNLMELIRTFNQENLMIMCSGPYLYEQIEVNRNDNISITLIGLGVESYAPGDTRIYTTITSYQAAKQFEQFIHTIH